MDKWDKQIKADINEHILWCKIKICWRGRDFVDKYHRKMFQTQVTVICRAV